MRAKPTNWTEEQHEIIRQEYPTTVTRELAEKLGVSPTVLRTRAKLLGVKKASWMHGRKKWTQGDIDQLRELYPHHNTKEISRVMQRGEGSINSQAHIMGLKKSKELLKKNKQKQIKLLLENGHKTRFKKGMTSWNKGKKLSPELYEKLKPTMFKKGNETWNKVEIGHQRITKDGYIEVKVEEPNRFELLHRFLWKVWVGPIPEGHNVQFINGDRKDCRIENLQLVSKSENMSKNTIQRYPADLRDTMLAIGRLKSKINKINTNN